MFGFGTLIKNVFDEIPFGVTDTFPDPVIVTPVLVEEPAVLEIMYAVGVPNAGTGVTLIGVVPMIVGDCAALLGVLITKFGKVPVTVVTPAPVKFKGTLSAYKANGTDKSC